MANWVEKWVWRHLMQSDGTFLFSEWGVHSLTPFQNLQSTTPPACRLLGKEQAPPFGTPPWHRSATLHLWALFEKLLIIFLLTKGYGPIKSHPQQSLLFLYYWFYLVHIWVYSGPLKGTIFTRICWLPLQCKFTQDCFEIILDTFLFNLYSFFKNLFLQPGCVNTTEVDIKKSSRMKNPHKTRKVQLFYHGCHLL